MPFLFLLVSLRAVIFILVFLGQTIFLKIFYVLDWGDFIFGAINSLFDPELRFFNYDDRKI